MRKAVITVACGLALAAIGSIGVLWLVGRSAASNDELLATLKAGMENHFSSIKSGRGRVREVATLTRGEPVSTLETDTNYTIAFSENRCRISTETNYVKNDPEPGRDVGDAKLVAPGTVRIEEMAYGGGQATLFLPTEMSARIGDNSTEVARYVRSKRVHALRELLPAPQAPQDIQVTTQIVRRETVNGDECIVLQESFADAAGGIQYTVTSQQWVVPQKDFTVKQSRSWVESSDIPKTPLGTGDFEYRNVDGMWIASRADTTAYAIDKTTRRVYKASHFVVTWDSDFRVNIAVGENDLSLKLPSGTRVNDESLDAQYTVP